MKLPTPALLRATMLINIYYAYNTYDQITQCYLFNSIKKIFFFFQ